MGTQNINIEQVQSGATINIFSDSAEEKNKKTKEISIAACDKYSSPLSAFINRTAYGKDGMQKVSFLLTNILMSQTIESNNIVLRSEEDAIRVFNNIADIIEGFKKEAEENHLHSAIIVPKIRNIMNELELKESKVHEPESDDLLIRHRAQPDVQGGMPAGLLLHPVNEHFPGHEGIVKQANNKSKYFHVISKNTKKYITAFNECFEKFSNNDNFDLEKYLSIMLYEDSDKEEERDIKTSSLINIRHAIKTEEISHAMAKLAIEKLGIITSKKILNDKVIDFSDYDTFVFDADETLWSGESACNMKAPIKRISENTVEDLEGKKITLKENALEVIKELVRDKKELGIVSKSEVKDVDYQNQPIILILREFGLLDYFKKMIVAARDLPKGMFIPENDRTIFIDDDVRNISQVKNEHDEIDTYIPEDDIFTQIAKDVFGEDWQPSYVMKIENEEDEKGLLSIQDENVKIAILDNSLAIIAQNKVYDDTNTGTISKQLEKRREKQQAIDERLNASMTQGFCSLSGNNNWFKAAEAIF